MSELGYTPEQHQQIERWIHDHHALADGCPSCNQRDDSRSWGIKAPIWVGDSLAGVRLALVALGCPKCAYVALYSALDMGVRFTDPADLDTGS